MIVPDLNLGIGIGFILGIVFVLLIGLYITRGKNV